MYPPLIKPDERFSRIGLGEAVRAGARGRPGLAIGSPAFKAAGRLVGMAVLLSESRMGSFALRS